MISGFVFLQIKKTTKELFLEVTSAVSLQTCKDVMDALIVVSFTSSLFSSQRSKRLLPKRPKRFSALFLVLSQKMAELNKFTAEQPEEVGGSDGEGDGPQDPAASGEPSSELTVQQVRTLDQDGNLKVVYPSKTDLCNDISNVTVLW